MICFFNGQGSQPIQPLLPQALTCPGPGVHGFIIRPSSFARYVNDIMSPCWSFNLVRVVTLILFYELGRSHSEVRDREGVGVGWPQVSHWKPEVGEAGESFKWRTSNFVHYLLTNMLCWEMGNVLMLCWGMGNVLMLYWGMGNVLIPNQQTNG